MDIKLKDIVEVKKFRTGRYVIKCSAVQEATICKLLHEHGYRRVKVEGRIYYFYRAPTIIIPITIEEVRKGFTRLLKQMLKDEEFSETATQEILNWFYERKNRVRQNGLLEKYLLETDELKVEDLKRIKNWTVPDYLLTQIPFAE